MKIIESLKVADSRARRLHFGLHGFGGYRVGESPQKDPRHL
jgi:hypothetical protein